MMEEKIRVAGIVNDSVTDGPGIRLTIFTQGCTQVCAGCQNPQTWDRNGGYDVTNGEILKVIDKNPVLDGITFSGGEPLLQAQKLIFLSQEVKKRGLTVMLYTGLLFEDILADSECGELLSNIWLLVDGKYIQELRTLDKLFTGSSNQRVIDVPKSLLANKVIEYT